jgi:hypothetical protein
MASRDFVMALQRRFLRAAEICLIRGRIQTINSDRVLPQKLEQSRLSHRMEFVGIV